MLLLLNFVEYTQTCQNIEEFVPAYNTHNRLCGLVVRGPGFDSWHYQKSWGVVGLEQGPLSLMSTIEELLGRSINGSGVESQEYGHGDLLL
jgi:hypothetical protein